MKIMVHSAIPAQVPALEALIETSARALSRGYYTAAQTEAAIAHVFGVDSELVADGTYLVATADGEIAGCGGWSQRATLFGGDRYAARSSGLLNPTTDPAKIRAFFIAAKFARRGVGTAILDACETAAASAGFVATELMATLPGVPFYQARGYRADPPVELDLDGIAVGFVPMRKSLDHPTSPSGRKGERTFTSG
jgi:GNAT superfamily N-acetyltransferase